MADRVEPTLTNTEGTDARTKTDLDATLTDATLTDATLADAARRSSVVSRPAGAPDAEIYAKDALLLDTYQVLSGPHPWGAWAWCTASITRAGTWIWR